MVNHASYSLYYGEILTYWERKCKRELLFLVWFLAPLIYEGGCPEGAGGSSYHNE